MPGLSRTPARAPRAAPVSDPTRRSTGGPGYGNAAAAEDFGLMLNAGEAPSSLLDEPTAGGDPAEGSMGGDGGARGDVGAGTGATPTPTGAATAAAPSPSANPAAPPTVSHTVVADGSARTRVGVGEKISFKSNMTGEWSSSLGTGVASGTSYEWVAPDVRGNAQITFTTSEGVVTKAITVIAPSGIQFGSPTPYGEFYDGITAGAGMEISVSLQPFDVSFDAVRFRELPGPASEVYGFFKSRSQDHKPSKSTLPFNKKNQMLGSSGEIGVDHAKSDAYEKPLFGFSEGGFAWWIPNVYQVGSGGEEHEFTKTKQQFSIDEDGKVTVVKWGTNKVDIARPFDK